MYSLVPNYQFSKSTDTQRLCKVMKKILLDLNKLPQDYIAP